MLPRRPRAPRRHADRAASALEWVGGRVELPLYVTEGEPYRPQGVMWVELPSRLILGWTLFDPRVPSLSFADTLREAMRSPQAGPPRRPPRVRVADETLAAEARAALADASGATEVVVAPTPEIDELVQLFAQSLPEGDEPDSYLEGGRVPPSAVEQLFRAAEALYHGAPWKHANDGQVVRLDVPEMGIAGAAISIIGALGQALGFVVFPSLGAFDAYLGVAERHGRDMRAGRAPKHLDLGSSLLSLTFDRAADLPDSMRKEALKRGWPVAGTDAYPRVLAIEHDGVARPLTERDVRLVAACALALGPFVLKHTALFAGRSREPASESYTGETELTVRLTAPYEAFDLFEKDAAAQLAFPDALADEEAAKLGPGWISADFALTGPGLPRPPEPGAVGGGRHIGRNDPCPCGSGKKYKRCHLGANAGATTAGPPRESQPLHDLDARLAQALAGYARERFGDAWLRFQDDFADAEAASQISLHWALYQLRVRGRRVVDHFLAERGDRLTGEEQAWLDAQSRSWLSIWEVQDARPGVSLDLQDLLTGERRHVVEASGSRTLVRRTAVLARIVDHGGLSLICGSHPQPLPPLAAAEVASAYRRRLRRGKTGAIERLREERLGRDLIADWEDARAALEDRARIPPRLRNSDGDELVFVTDRFDFDPAARAEIETRLAAMPGVVVPEDAAADRDYVFHPEGAAPRPRREDLVVGNARVGERALAVETNSLRRADALRRRVEAALGALVRHRRRGRRDAQRMVERAWERGPSGRDAGAPGGDAGARDDLANDPEAQQMLREMKERHYADWADQPLPALGGKTARQAVRTARGRERVDALLKDIEHSEARLPLAERFDVSALRRSLGL